MHPHLNLVVTSATAPTRGGPNTGHGCTHVIEVSRHDMYTLVVLYLDQIRIYTDSQAAKTRVQVLSFAQREGGRRGRAYLAWWALVAGKAPYEDLSGQMRVGRRRSP
jgi:hypothetical protein